MTSRFAEAAPQLLDAVRVGATLDEACRRLGVKVRTARDWAHRGRKDPEGRYGSFARDLDSIREARRLPPAAGRGALGREEWEACLADAVRAGNVQALRLWHETHHVVEAVEGDPFAEFDPPAAR